MFPEGGLNVETGFFFSSLVGFSGLNESILTFLFFFVFFFFVVSLLSNISYSIPPLDCLHIGYLYFHAAPDAPAFHQELVKRVKNLHTADCLRANKSTMAWGLEARVPFLDKVFLEDAMAIDPKYKEFGKGAEQKVDEDGKPMMEKVRGSFVLHGSWFSSFVYVCVFGGEGGVIWTDELGFKVQTEKEREGRTVEGQTGR